MSERKSISLSGIKGVVTPNGVALQQPDSGEFNIKVTAVTTVNGINQYSWTKVTRASDGSWQDSSQKGAPGFDPAYEMNNSNATLNLVYRAKRDPNTGQPLFF